MSFQASIQSSQHNFQVEADETLLEAALRQGLTLPYGCRDGACGACRGQVLSGRIDHGKAQIHALSVPDRAAGFALFCCAKAQSDLVVECKEARSLKDFPVKTMPARVQTLTLAAPDVMILELKLPASERLQFLAGQYIDILLKDGKRRAFSLANAPHDDASLQLHIRQTPGGQFTGHVFGTMKERDILRFNGPHGTFFLREDSKKPILMIAGGTGFAPIKAMIEHAIAEKSDRPITLYWGGRASVDLYHAALAEQWASTHPHIRFVPVLSEPDAVWGGRRGLVHEVAMQDFPDLSAHQVYVCGAPGMVVAARRDLVSRCQLPEDQFFADSFDFACDSGNESGNEPGNNSATDVAQHAQ
jgi:CDP-4-dehydro-6-deoxyglucose reductase